MLGLFADVAPGRSLVDELDRSTGAPKRKQEDREDEEARQRAGRWRQRRRFDASALLAVLRKEEGAGIVSRGDRTRSGR